MNWNTKLVVGAWMVAGAMGTAQADPVAVVNRTFTEYTGAGPIGDNNINDDNKFFWFYESSGTYLGNAVDSYILLWDPRTSLSVSGTVTFAGDIVALMDDQAELVATASFQKAGVTYNLSNAAVGLEAGDKANTGFAGAVLSLSGNGWTASDPGDMVRVFVKSNAVPTPGSLALAGLALLALGVSARRAGSSRAWG